MMKAAKEKLHFDQIWAHLEPKARELGVIDGDLPAARTAVKNLLVASGWSSGEGAVDFVSKSDMQNCLRAAAQEIGRVAPGLAAARRVTFRTSLAASTGGTASAEPVTLTSTQQQSSSSAAFKPQMGKIGDACPRCSAGMLPVALVNARSALYCTKDRVVVPLPNGFVIQ